MNLTEKTAYIRGLADGLTLDMDKPESKLISALIEIVDDLAATCADIDDGMSLMAEQVNAIDTDLDDLESYIFDDDDDDDDDDYFEVECPACGETICVDEDILADGSINCPNCDELLEFEIEDGCDCGCDGCCDE